MFVSWIELRRGRLEAPPARAACCVRTDLVKSRQPVLAIRASPAHVGEDTGPGLLHPPRGPAYSPSSRATATADVFESVPVQIYGIRSPSNSSDVGPSRVFAPPNQVSISFS